MCMPVVIALRQQQHTCLPACLTCLCCIPSPCRPAYSPTSCVAAWMRGGVLGCPPASCGMHCQHATTSMPLIAMYCHCLNLVLSVPSHAQAFLLADVAGLQPHLPRLQVRAAAPAAPQHALNAWPWRAHLPCTHTLH
jgi:hypothetical protein